MVQIKEDLEPTPPTTTAAQITYQRFFARYLHLGGSSGTLREARHELQRLYGCHVVAVPLARPDQRLWLGEQVFASVDAKWAAVVAAVQRERARGRPVLVGTDSVAASAQLSARLLAAGIEHQVLNALQDADEAQRIARAGQRGVVTVATNIAGRGTDIHLGEGVAVLGGLHVIATMRNRSQRIDRQLIGRAARHGDPGSAECLLALDDGLLRRSGPAVLRRATAHLVRKGVVPQAPARALFAWAQARAQRHDRRLRHELRRAERQLGELYGFAGGTE
jgi:preprotein translocase subunit SecA